MASNKSPGRTSQPPALPQEGAVTDPAMKQCVSAWRIITKCLTFWSLRTKKYALFGDLLSKLLKRQKEKAEEFLRAEPLPLEDIEPWKALTIDILIKALGSNSAGNFLGVLHNWQTHSYGFYGDEREIEDTQNGLKRSILVLADCIELLEHMSPLANEEATIEVRPARASAVGSKERMILETTFGRYTTGTSIGEGGAVRVFEATDEAGQSYATKLLDPRKATGDKRKRFKNEVLFGIKNEHPNIIRIIDHGLYKNGKDESPFYVMPSYKGTLRKLIKSGIHPEKVLPYSASSSMA